MTSLQYRGPKQCPAHQVEKLEISIACAPQGREQPGKQHPAAKPEEGERQIGERDHRPGSEDEEAAARAQERPHQAVTPWGRERRRIESGIMPSRRAVIRDVVTDERDPGRHRWGQEPDKAARMPKCDPARRGDRKREINRTRTNQQRRG